MPYYAIVKNSKILFRYPINTLPESLSYYLTCARDRFGACVSLERLTPHPDGLITEILVES